MGKLRTALAQGVLYALSGISIIAADAVPATNLVDWIPGVTVGVRGGIPTNWPIWTNVVDAGMDNTGHTNISTLLTTLIQTAPSGVVIRLPRGKYLWNGNAFNMGAKKGVILRGDGKTNTYIVDATSPGGAFEFAVGAGAPISAKFGVFSGATRGSSNLSVISPINATVGNLLVLGRTNDFDRGDITVTGAQDQFTTLMEITAVSAVTNITFWPPLGDDFTNGPYARTHNGFANYVGFEDFTWSATNNATGVRTGRPFLSTSVAKNIWVKDVRFFKVQTIALNPHSTLFGEVRNCDFWQTLTVGAGTAFNILTECASWLYENNFGFENLLIENNASGMNAFVNNFNYASYSSNPSITNQAIGNDFSANHGSGGSHCLWEGNKAGTFQADGYFGNTRNHTVYRNWFMGKHPTLPDAIYIRCVDLCRFTRSYHVAGNVLGHPALTNWLLTSTNASTPLGARLIYRVGFPNPGNYAFTNKAPTDNAWNWPGPIDFATFRRSFVITLTNNLVATNTIWGNMTNLIALTPAFFQRASATNEYYGGWPDAAQVLQLVSAVNGTSTNAVFNQNITANSGDHLYQGGANGFQSFRYDVEFPTHSFNGNWSYDSNDGIGHVLWDARYPTNLVPSYVGVSAGVYRTSAPDYWDTNLFRWPAFGPDLNPKVYTNTTEYMLPAEARFHSLPDPLIMGPGAPIGLTAVGGSTQISVGWNSEPDATGYSVYRSTSSGGTFTNIASAFGSPYVDTGLAENTTYYYKVTTLNTNSVTPESAFSGLIAATTFFGPPGTEVIVSGAITLSGKVVIGVEVPEPEIP